MRKIEIPENPTEAARTYKEVAVEAVTEGLSQELFAKIVSVGSEVKKVIDASRDNDALRVWARVESGIDQFREEGIAARAIKTMKGL